jgi:hypothetical protein
MVPYEWGPNPRCKCSLPTCWRITLRRSTASANFSDLQAEARSYASRPGDSMYRRIVGCLWIATLTAAPAAAQQPFTLEHFRKFVGVGGWS